MSLMIVVQRRGLIGLSFSTFHGHSGPTNNALAKTVHFHGDLHQWCCTEHVTVSYQCTVAQPFTQGLTLYLGFGALSLKLKGMPAAMLEREGHPLGQTSTFSSSILTLPSLVFLPLSLYCCRVFFNFC